MPSEQGHSWGVLWSQSSVSNRLLMCRRKRSMSCILCLRETFCTSTCMHQPQCYPKTPSPFTELQCTPSNHTTSYHTPMNHPSIHRSSCHQFKKCSTSNSWYHSMSIPSPYYLRSLHSAHLNISIDIPIIPITRSCQFTTKPYSHRAP